MSESSKRALNEFKIKFRPVINGRSCITVLYNINARKTISFMTFWRREGNIIMNQFGIDALLLKADDYFFSTIIQRRSERESGAYCRIWGKKNNDNSGK